MAQLQIELILARQLAGCLSLPVFLVNPAGDLLYYNEPAEGLLGTRFQETGEMPLADWATSFKSSDDDGHPLAPIDQPLVIAVTYGRPAHRPFWIQGRDGQRRRIEVTGLPLVDCTNQTVGGMAIFWESPP